MRITLLRPLLLVAIVLAGMGMMSLYNKKTYSLSLNNVAGMTEAFQFNSATGSCTGAGTCYRQFADTNGSEAAQTLISSTTPADNHNVYICYKAVISNTQAAGDYENFLTFIATATF
jgi:hypothetical protein